MPLNPKKTTTIKKPFRCGPGCRHEIKPKPGSVGKSELIRDIVYKQFDEVAAKIADVTTICINQFTPMDNAVTYPRQYVLEEVIKILQSRV